jgi:hypothetical protein
MMGQLVLDPDITGAMFSLCRAYRYMLWRRWGPGKRALWIMLNPSTADETTLDPTLTRCLRYSQRWGYGAMFVANVFALRSTDPRGLSKVSDPVGPDNDSHILVMAKSPETGIVICGWGNHGERNGRNKQVLELLEGIPLHCLEMTRSGQPRHPLYCKGDLVPQPYRLETA